MENKTTYTIETKFIIGETVKFFDKKYNVVHITAEIDLNCRTSIYYTLMNDTGGYVNKVLEENLQSLIKGEKL